ncbi:MAG: tetratricopeptide repeat protein [archaeon]|nr:tetratricopeptide repeat protein [archaeon]MCP8306566.1 tetratricopeptide repeat protein [archaeon]
MPNVDRLIKILRRDKKPGHIVHAEFIKRFVKGTCLANLKKYREAINCYYEVLGLNPHDEASSFSKGQCLQALKRRTRTQK